MEDDWLPAYELDANELCYGIPTDTKNILSLTQKIINSPFVDNFQGFDLEILLEFDQLDDEFWEEEPEIIEYEISSLTESLRGRIESLLQETHKRFGFESDISGWTEGFAVVAEYTEDKKKLIDCIRFLIHQPNFLEYCTVSVSFYLNPVSTSLDDPGFIAVCEEIEKRTGGEFSIRGKAELGPYDGIEAGSSFYQLYLLVSPHYEFPLRFFRGHSEDNRLASSYYHYIFSRICRSIDCKLTLLKT